MSHTPSSDRLQLRVITPNRMTYATHVRVQQLSKNSSPRGHDVGAPGSHPMILTGYFIDEPSELAGNAEFHEIDDYLNQHYECCVSAIFSYVSDVPSLHGIYINTDIIKGNIITPDDEEMLMIEHVMSRINAAFTHYVADTEKRIAKIPRDSKSTPIASSLAYTAGPDIEIAKALLQTGWACSQVVYKLDAVSYMVNRYVYASSLPIPRTAPQVTVISSTSNDNGIHMAQLIVNTSTHGDVLFYVDYIHGKYAVGIHCIGEVDSENNTPVSKPTANGRYVLDNFTICVIVDVVQSIFAAQYIQNVILSVSPSVSRLNTHETGGWELMEYVMGQNPKVIAGRHEYLDEELTTLYIKSHDIYTLVDRYPNLKMSDLAPIDYLIDENSVIRNDLSANPTELYIPPGTKIVDFNKFINKTDN